MLSKIKEKDIFSAYQLYVNGKLLKALKEFEEFYAAHPDSLSSLNMIATIALLLKDTKKSETVYNKLLEKFLNSGELDKALSIINKLELIMANHDTLYKLRADIFRKKNRNELAIRQLIILAERYRHAGSFDACVKLYLDLADNNPENYRLINKIIQKLTIIGAYEPISKVLKKATEHDLFPHEELDNLIVFLIEAGANAENVVPFIGGFLQRHPDAFGLVSAPLLDFLKKEFDPELFNVIVSSVPLSETADFTAQLKDLISDAVVVKHNLRLEAGSDNRNLLKGLIFELYIENALDVYDVADICVKSGSYIPLEETLKLTVSSMEKKDILASLNRLCDIYSNAGQNERAASMAVYTRYSAVPDSLSDVFSNPPEDPHSIEKRLDVRTDVKPSNINLESDPVQVETKEPVAAAELQPEISPEPFDVPEPENRPESSVDSIYENHIFEEYGGIEIQKVQLDEFDTGGELHVDTGINLADDFFSAGPNDVGIKPVNGLETFAAPDKPVPEVFSEPESVTVQLDFSTAQQETAPDFIGFGDEASEPDSSGFSGFDLTPEEKPAEDDFFSAPAKEKESENEVVQPEIITAVKLDKPVIETSEVDINSLEMDIQPEIKEPEPQIVETITFNDSELVQASKSSAGAEDMFAGLVDDNKQEKAGQVVHAIIFDENELKKATSSEKKEDSDFFSQEI